MRFSLSREAFLKPLQQVVNVVERRQTLPVLSNLLVQVENGLLSLKGTDLEVELAARCSIDDGQDGEVTVPARKLFDIVRALPDGSKIVLSHSGDKATIQAGKAATPWQRCPPGISRKTTNSPSSSASGYRKPH